MFTVDKHRFTIASSMVCHPGAGGRCAFPAWHGRDLVVGVLVGVALGLLTLTGERAGRRALVAEPLGVRRMLGSGPALFAVGQALRPRPPGEVANAGP